MNLKKEKILEIKTIRILIQIISFIAFAGIFAITYGSIKSLYISVIEGSFDVITYLPQIIILCSVFLLIIIFGRFFCGWICAFGTLMDLLHFVSYKIIGKKIMVNYKLDKVLKCLKYIVLAISVIFIWTLGQNLFCGGNPWDIFGIYTSFGQAPSLNECIRSNVIGVTMLVVILGGGLLVERFFCRYLCPLGAIFTILSKLRIIKIKKIDNNCGRCSCCGYKRISTRRQR